jgi:hypothetical protein
MRREEDDISLSVASCVMDLPATVFSCPPSSLGKSGHLFLDGLVCPCVCVMLVHSSKRQVSDDALVVVTRERRIVGSPRNIVVPLPENRPWSFVAWEIWETRPFRNENRSICCRRECRIVVGRRVRRIRMILG